MGGEAGTIMAISYEKRWAKSMESMIRRSRVFWEFLLSK